MKRFSFLICFCLISLELFKFDISASEDIKKLTKPIGNKTVFFDTEYIYSYSGDFENGEVVTTAENPVWIFFDETNIFYVEEDGEVFCYDFALKEKHTFENDTASDRKVFDNGKEYFWEDNKLYVNNNGVLENIKECVVTFEPRADFLRIITEAQLKNTFLWNLLKENYPHAAKKQYVDARIDNPNNVFKMLSCLKEYERESQNGIAGRKREFYIEQGEAAELADVFFKRNFPETFVNETELSVKVINNVYKICRSNKTEEGVIYLNTKDACIFAIMYNGEVIEYQITQEIVKEMAEIIFKYKHSSEFMDNTYMTVELKNDIYEVYRWNKILVCGEDRYIFFDKWDGHVLDFCSYE